MMMMRQPIDNFALRDSSVSVLICDPNREQDIATLFMVVVSVRKCALYDKAAILAAVESDNHLSVYYERRMGFSFGHFRAEREISSGYWRAPVYWLAEGGFCRPIFVWLILRAFFHLLQAGRNAPAIIVLGFALNSGLVTSALSFTISTELEAIRVSSVGGSYTSVTFENTYSNPVAVCTYVLPSSAAPPATVRLTSVSSTGMLVKVQQFPNSSSVTASDVHCLIAESGAHTLPDGRAFEAHTVLSTATHGQNAADGWNMAALENVSGSIVNSYSNPVVLAQVMTDFDANASVAYVNDCDNRGNVPFQSGMADGMCVSKHIGQMSGSRSNEVIGYIVAEGGVGSFDDIAYELALGADSVAGVGNSPPYNYGLSGDYEIGAATQNGEDGGQGGWAVLYGTNPWFANGVSLAIEEEIVAGDASRRHTTENVAYWGFRRTPQFTITKDVDLTEIAEPTVLSYTIVLENTGRLDLTSITISDTLPDGSTGTLSGPTESLTGGTAGTLEVGETWTYTISYSSTTAEIVAGTPLTNAVTSGNAEYTSIGYSDETDNAITTIVAGAPSLSVLKSFTLNKLAGNTGASAEVGDTIDYTYVVTNTGNVTVSNIDIDDSGHTGQGTFAAPLHNAGVTTDNGASGDSTDTNADPAIWGALAPSDVITFTASYVVTQADMDAQ